MFDRTSVKELISGDRRGILSGTIRLGLSCLTPFYRFVIWLRNLSFDKRIRRIHSVSVPVVSVGNLTTGGTGKTPMVIWLSEFFRDREKKIAILSRGYGRGDREKNDEALELEHRLPGVPHLQSPDRATMAREAIFRFGAELLILDDGFQHRRIERDLDIVLIDATNPFGYGHLLPRGLLREPISSLSRADMVVVTRCELVTPQQLESIKQTVLSVAPNIRLASTQTSPTTWLQTSGDNLRLEALNGKCVFTICAIGNPQAFFDMVDNLNVNQVDKRVFADHHHFRQQELSSIGHSARRQGCDAIVCTHKDLVKIGCDDLNGIPVYALQVNLKFESGELELKQLLESLPGRN